MVNYPERASTSQDTTKIPQHMYPRITFITTGIPLLKYSYLFHVVLYHRNSSTADVWSVCVKSVCIFRFQTQKL